MPKIEGLYVQGYVAGQDVVLTVDTGATFTLISKEVYDDIPQEKRPKLYRKQGKTFVNANGQSMKYYGRGVFEVYIGPLKYRKLFSVVDIKDDVLLGLDILRASEGHATIHVGGSEMTLQGVTIPLIHIGGPRESISPKSRKVHAADHYIIEGMSEQLIECVPDRREWDGEDKVIIGASPMFVENHGVDVAPIAVDLSGKPTVKVRVFNPFPDSVSIKQDTVVGEIEELDPDYEWEVLVKE
jgi:hypothetical protein